MLASQLFWSDVSHVKFKGIVVKLMSCYQLTASDHLLEEPEVFSFREKLNLHKNVVGELSAVPARPHSTIITDDLLTLQRKEFCANSARPVLADDFNLQQSKHISGSAAQENQTHYTLVTENVTSDISTHDCQSGEVLNRNNNCSNGSCSPYIASVLASQPTSTLRIPDDAEIPQTEEHLKRKAWRDKMMATLSDQLQQAEFTILQYKNQSISLTASAEQGQVYSAVQDLTIANSPQCIDKHQIGGSVISVGDKATV